ncbi:hypothetical protein AM493_17280 [Flavobacterium akiainvivens]|uniref:Uncharacterized protein n=1 Tax=Flavobacterium akiainvivens TaxID=1202724 RepID=A0A0M8MF45_9FLAO|nr:hypothetical protein [Flavobacterium akiainvivens]KOS07594.1 hypothetical protein AM493_17280 [Flavobacterium akiainvivens]SFQ22401.1 hypothetical protein SAMN05444144_10236 [Flavobacterium akiainvivens]
MKKYTVLLVFFTFYSVFAQTRRDFDTLPVVWPDTTAVKTGPLKFVPITGKQFNDIRAFAIANKNAGGVPAPVLKDSKLIVATKNALFELPAGGGYESSYSYIQYVPEIRSHLISRCGEGACSAYLLDHETNGIMYVPSSYDSGVMGFSVSPSGKYFLVYSSYDGPDYADYYTTRSEFMIYSIGQTKGMKGLRLYREFESTEWSIDEMVWLDNSTLALKVYAGNAAVDMEPVQYKYYETVIK